MSHAALRAVIADSASGIDSAMAEFLDRGTAPGIAYGVVLDGEVVHGGGLGLARLDGTVPTTASPFRIASMTKSFTAVALLQLRDEGRLALDAPVSTYVPELAGLALPTSDSVPPTVREVLTMSAGWATDDPWADREESMTPAEFTALLAGGFTFNAAPGIGFEYSNLGYTILGRVITNLAGEHYRDVVTERVLRAVGMAGTGFSLEDVAGDLLAQGHFRRDDAWHVEPVLPTGEFAPLGGLFSTVDDLARWVGVMASAFPARDDADDAVPLRRSSLREMQQGQRLAEMRVAASAGEDALVTDVVSYAFGLAVRVHPVVGEIVSHSGGYPGYGTHMCWHPATGLGVVALANGRYAEPMRAAQKVLASLVVGSGSPARMLPLTPATTRMREQVDVLLDAWDDSLLDSLVSPNVDHDEPRDHRRADVAASVAAVGGSLGPAHEITTSAGSQLVWWRRGASGRVRVEIALTPERPQRLETLIVRAVPDPSAALMDAATTVVESLARGDALWPTAVPVAPGVDTSAVLRAGALARALDGGVLVLDPAPVKADSAHAATLRLRGARTQHDLTLERDETTGDITAAELTMVPLAPLENLPVG